MFPSAKQKVLLVINVIIILLYFLFDLASFALFVTPEFNILWKFIAIIFPWIIIYFTAPRTNNGDKPTLSVWSVILFFYYIYNGNIQIKGNAHMHHLMGGNLITSELRFNMIIAILLSCLAFVSSLGILYRKKGKHQTTPVTPVIQPETKPVEYIYYDKDGNVSETPTDHKVRK